MIKRILATMLGLVVVAVFLLAMGNPAIFFIALVLCIAYTVGKSMIG